MNDPFQHQHQHRLAADIVNDHLVTMPPIAAEIKRSHSDGADPDLTIIDEVKLDHATLQAPQRQQVWVSSEMMSSKRGRIKGVPPTQGDKFTVNGRVIEQKDARLKLWRRLIAVAVQQARWQPIPPGPVRVDLTFVLPRPKSHYNAAGLLKPNAPTICTVKPDVDKLARAVLDALTQCSAIGDDATVADLHVTKPYTLNGGVGVLIVVEPIRQSIVPATP